MQTLSRPRLMLCFKCKEAKPEDEFYKSDKVSRGVSTQCKECTLERQREYQRTHKRKRKPAKRNPKAERAGNITRNAIIHGFLIRSKKCSVDGCTNKPQSHHEDYSKPLDVTWLCGMHHMRLHKRGKTD